MKWFKYLLIPLFVASNAFGQAYPIRNENLATLRDLASELNVGRNFAVTRKGEILIGGIVPGTGATSLGKPEDAPAISGDTGVFALAVRNDTGSTTLTNTNGDYSGIAVDSAGRLISEINQANQSNSTTSMLKLQSGTAGTGDSGVAPMYYRESAISTTGVAVSDGLYSRPKADANGAVWERPNPNVDTGAMITATGATTTQTGADQINYGGRCIQCMVDVTTAGTGSITFEIDYKDTASGKYTAILASAAIVTISNTNYVSCPGSTAVANVVQTTALPRTWRVKTTANNANAMTYTVGCSVTE